MPSKQFWTDNMIGASWSRLISQIRDGLTAGDPPCIGNTAASACCLPRVGKTTLAQLVYNDSTVLVSAFDLRDWVLDSEVTRDQACNHSDDLNLLPVTLIEKLSGKRCLMVLDDVCNVGQDQWDLLCLPLSTSEVKMLATTRNNGHCRGREGLRLRAGTSSNKFEDIDSVGMIADEGSPCTAETEVRCKSEAASNSGKNSKQTLQNIVGDVSNATQPCSIKSSIPEIQVQHSRNGNNEQIQQQINSQSRKSTNDSIPEIQVQHSRIGNSEQIQQQINIQCSKSTNGNNNQITQQDINNNQGSKSTGTNGHRGTQSNLTNYREAPSKFTSNGHGFQAQQKRHPTSPNRRPPPPGERRMTIAEREQYRDHQCQYCGMAGHIAKICWWVPKKPTQQEEIPQALATLTLDTNITDTEWTADTGASNHMTGKLGMLTNIRQYTGDESVLIGDGSSMPILAIGDTCIKQKATTLPLNDVLLVPKLTKNLLSERETALAVMKGKRKGDLYVLPASPELYFSHRFKSTTVEIWHQRLGHP
ncbi:hypothetical protein SADUNF_Sadunf16G0148700 [Salix dunnii]|uniref:CCHC-type domain-containing protein n=1 Tax=Salix dunnii TaxID=1413687 RepID=A0A835JA97_9ROSI|nr:hypothetical protein SADUNF_Sadunf16G0148700 [Salix dunnii]